MTQEQQKEILRELIAGVAKRMARQFDLNNVPEDWDGIELRQWLADVCADNTLPGGMSRNRKVAYRNAILTRNLV